uniref:Uncharacterized protein n=1 Tax=viral metagenome TaxID=1070528 RepID=A0A6C0HZ31_9ZZZZ
MPFYTYNCTLILAHDCDKYETPLRIIYTPTEPITSKHFLFHDIEKIDTDEEYGVLGKLRKIIYYKQTNNWQIIFDNIGYDIDPMEKVFMYENVKR